jgi:DHA2 family multidrug resistance protein
VQSNTQLNHALIGSLVTPFERSLWTGAALHYWNPSTAHGAAMLNEEITRQASIIAYIDDFKLMLILALCSMPLVLLIRREPTQAVRGDHAAVME